MVPEAKMKQDEAGRSPATEGWFVLNARDGRWRDRPERGKSLPLTGWTDEECETLFPQLGVNLFVLGPGETMAMYHWEADAEDYLILSGEALLIIEGEERPLRQWDFVHVPPQAGHNFLGAGDGLCAVLAIGAREHQMDETAWGGYTPDETARRHGVSVDEETSDAEIAYARFEASRPAAYQEGWLP